MVKYGSLAHINRKPGVYKITINKRIYIGSTVNCYTRRAEHISQLRSNTHNNKFLTRAFNKYTEGAFIFEIIEYCDKEKCVEREQYYLDTLLFAQEYIKNNDPRFRELGYNLNPTAYSPIGLKWTEEQKEGVRGENNWAFGTIRTQEQKLQHSLFMKGRYTGVNSPNYGIKRSTETIEKYRKCKLGSKDSDETRKKKSGRVGTLNATFGRKHTDSERELMSNVRRGKPAPRRTPVTILNLESGIFTEFDYSNDVATVFGCGRQNIQLYIKSGNPYKNHLIFYDIDRKKKVCYV